MAKTIYKNYQLQRTLPKLSGNMQLDVVLGFNQAEAYVEQAHLRPLSKYVNYAPVVDERIMDRPHHLNIKKFYEKTKAGFFTQPASPVLTSDWPLLISASEMPNIKYIKEFDDTYFAGCQQMSHKLYGASHEILVPVWLDQCLGIRFTIHISNTGPRYKQTTIKMVTLDLSKDTTTNSRFHNDFVDYISEFFNYVNITKGTNNVMSVNFRQNMATISGLQVESGNFVTRQNLNIARNLLYRERPLLEANSLLTNSFMDYKMICPQLINFNLCFDLEKMLRQVGFSNTFDRLNIWVTSEVKRETGWEPLVRADFYTNHHYIPKQRLGSTAKETFDIYDDSNSQYPRNVLDYKNDFMCTAMMHANKMTQSICHWYYADQPEDMLFNVYDGFGAYRGDAEYNHGYGAMADINDDTYDESLDNTIWTGRIPEVQSEQDTVNILSSPSSYIVSGYFKDASNFINGIKFTYDPSTAKYNPDSSRNAPSAVYFGTATSPKTVGQFVRWTAQSNITDNPTTVAIITTRNSSGALEDLPQSQKQQKSGNDIKWDWHKYSDMDNRFMVRRKNAPTNQVDYRAYFDPTGEYLLEGTWVWLPVMNGQIPISGAAALTDADFKRNKCGENGEAINVKNPNYGGIVTRNMLVRIGGSGDINFSVRNEDNANGLFVSYMRTPVDIGKPQKDDPLYVIFWTKAMNKITATTTGMVYKKLTPDAILLGNIRNALLGYWNKYGAILEIINKMVDAGEIDPPTDLPDMDDLEIIVNIMANIEPADVLYFNNSIQGNRDITLSVRAREIEYFKDNEANSYVWRYAGKIKPAIYPLNAINGPRVTRKNTENDSSELEYRGWYGRNFIWHKTPIFSTGQLMPPNIAQYVNRNIAPTYPSLDYEVVNQMITTGKYHPNKHGDMLYDEVPHMYLGMANDSVDKYSYTAADFGFERRNKVNPFSFLKNVLNEDDIRSYLNVTDEEWNEMDENKKYEELMKSPLYNMKAREAVMNNLFNINMLTGRDSNSIGYWLYAPEYNTYEWPEFKWFNRSYVVGLPQSFEYTQAFDVNDKETLERDLLNRMLAELASKNSSVAKLCDRALLKSLYDFYYDLIKTESIPVEDGEAPLLKYIYNIKATLK